MTTLTISNFTHNIIKQNLNTNYHIDFSLSLDEKVKDFNEFVVDIVKRDNVSKKEAMSILRYYSLKYKNETSDFFVKRTESAVTLNKVTVLNILTEDEIKMNQETDKILHEIKNEAIESLKTRCGNV